MLIQPGFGEIRFPIWTMWFGILSLFVQVGTINKYLVFFILLLYL